MWRKLVFFPAAALLLTAFATQGFDREAWDASFRSAEKNRDAGNFRDAYDAFAKLLADAPPNAAELPLDDCFSRAVNALERLNRIDEYDAFFETVAARHPRQLALLARMAGTSVYASGSMQEGRFVRGERAIGNYFSALSAAERDRARDLQLLAAALDAAAAAPDGRAKQDFYLALAAALRDQRERGLSWKLQELTALDRLPAYDDPRPDYIAGAPVDERGQPVFYQLPDGFAAAGSDGERFHWALEQARRAGSTRAVLAWADFLDDEFGIPEYDKAALAPYRETDGLRTLPDEETVVRLADGVRKLTLPDEFNALKILQSQAAAEKPNYGVLEKLADIRHNRDQFDREVALLRRMLELYGDGNAIKGRIAQRTGNYGVFFPGTIAAAGKQPAVRLLFRNASSIELVLRPIDRDRLIDRWLAGLRQVNRSGEEICQDPYNPLEFLKPGKAFADCVGEPIKSWRQPLEPADGFQDREVALTIPVDAPGVYLLDGRFEGGATLQTLVWIDSLAAFARDVTGGTQLFVTEIAAGVPVADAEVKAVVIRQHYARNPEEEKAFGGRVKLEVKEFTGRTGTRGEVEFRPPAGFEGRSYFVITGKNGGKSLIGGAYMTSARRDEDPRRDTAYVISDRPLYRPGDTVNLRYCRHRADYAAADPAAAWAGKTVTCAITSPRGRELANKTLTLDRFAAASFDYELPEDAELGVYRVGGGSFRVEEFKKPEYLLSIAAPVKPVRFGESFTVAIEGKYYFGEPVRQAKISYKIERRAVNFRPFYLGPWHWLYGDGYDRMCRTAESGRIFRRPQSEPELVAQGDGYTGDDGKFELKIATDDRFDRFIGFDCEYVVSAEIADSSRRIVRAAANVRAAKTGFRVELRPLRGFGETGQPFEIAVDARTPDGKMIRGDGRFVLRRQVLKEGAVVTAPAVLLEREIRLDGEETATIPLVINQPGVYELSGSVRDEAGESNPASCLLRIRGDARGADLFSALPLEISRDRETYQVGERANLLLSSRYADAVVFVFPRPERFDGGFQVVPLAGGSALVPLELSGRDQPNTFVDVVLVHDGELHRATLTLPAPPAKRLLTVDVVPAAPHARPGERTAVKIKVSESDGRPADGIVTVTVYDRALDDLAGGSNVGPINAAFWGFRRRWHGSFYSSLDATIRSDTSARFIFDRMVLGRKLADGNMWMENDAMPRPAGAPMVQYKAVAADAAGPGGGAAESAAAFAVRENFRDRILWIAERRLNADGSLELPVELPDNLTAWKVKVWSLAAGGAVGEGEADIVVSKEIIARLELPRFLVEGDRATATATLHNYTGHPLKLAVTLRAAGAAAAITGPDAETVAVAPNGTAVVEWQVRALQAGEAEFELAARTDGRGDGVKLKLPVAVNGVEQTLTASGAAAAGQPAGVPVDLPAAIRPGSAKLTIDLAASPALAMLKILPHFATDDGRNIFSTVDRFLPALRTKQALTRLGIPFAKLTVTDPELYRNLARHPLADPAAFDKTVKSNLKMIGAMQNADGGWGWFSGYAEQSYPDTTCCVVDALLAIREPAPDGFDAEVLARGIDWLVRFQRDRLEEWKSNPPRSSPDNLDAKILLTLARDGKFQPEVADFLYRRRAEKLSPGGLALLGLAMQLADRREELAMLLANLDQYARDDAARGTAFLEIPNRDWFFFWYGNDTETQANYLRLLLAAAPDHPRIVPLARYLATNIAYAPGRNSLRSIGAGVTALAEYLDRGGESAPDLAYDVKFDGQSVGSGRITAANILDFDSTIEVPAKLLTAGRHQLEFSVTGRGALYFGVRTGFFNLSRQVEPAGVELKLTRRYWRLTPKTVGVHQPGGRGQLAGVDFERFDRAELADGGSVESGDLVEVELNLESGNDYDYVVVSDPRPAGFVALSPESGYLPTWPAIYAEYREQATCFYLRSLRRGANQIRCRFRAQQPGAFNALPATGAGVYAPLLRANTGRLELQIK